MLRTAVLLVSLLSLIACASSAPAGTRRSRNLITREEIAASQGTTAYEVIQSVRPEFLRTRGSVSGTGAQAIPVVYIDGVRAGQLGALRQVGREVIEEIRYVGAQDATTMYGTGHGGGAIMVKTRR